MKKIIFLGLALVFMLMLAGCGNNEENTAENNTGTITNQAVLKSADSGKSFEFKGKIDSKKTIGPVNVLSIELNSSDGKTIYIGTEKNGLYSSNDGGETWKKLEFPLTKIYGLTLGNADGTLIYASGLLDKRGKIYRSNNGGEKWEEIYSEAADGTVISSLKTLKNNSQIVYAGTDKGAIFKTVDGGVTWKNIHKAGGAIIDINVDAQNSEVIYFGIYQNGVLRTKDGGNNIEDVFKNNQLGLSLSRNVHSVEADPTRGGVVYIGVDNGIIRGLDYGDKSEPIDILESAKSQPVKALAVSPSNPDEISFSTAQAFYKSTDGGKQWAVYQLESAKYVETMEYDSTNSGNIFLGLRK